MKLTAHPPIPGVTEARIKRNDVIFDGIVQSIELVECEISTRVNAITYAAALRDHGIGDTMKLAEVLKYDPANNALLAEYQIDEKFLDISVRDATVFNHEMITFFDKALA
jgi:hypothetical protein